MKTSLLTKRRLTETFASLANHASPWEPTSCFQKMAEEEENQQTDLEKRIIEAFEVFDHVGSKTVDVREIGTIIRSLGCCPSEAEIQEILVEVEDQESSGSVHLAHFLPVMTQLIIENRLQPASPEQLLQAFLTLDKEKKGFVDKELLGNAMMAEGEPFTQEELDEMMAAAIDPETNNIQYEYYINQLMVERKEGDVWSLVPPPPPEEVKRVWSFL